MVVHWNYATVVKPVLTYSAMVWWLRVRYSVSRIELSRLQRLACLLIMGIIKTVPTTAMDVLGLLPLHVIVEVEAQAGIYTLTCTKQWRPKSTNSSYAKNSWVMEHKAILHMGSDRMELRHKYHKPFTVKFPDKCG